MKISSPKVDNKWVDIKGVDMRVPLNKPLVFIKTKSGRIGYKAVQTQQETLEEVLDGIERLKYEIPCVYKNCAGINLIELDKLCQTIKKKKEEGK